MYRVRPQLLFIISVSILYSVKGLDNVFTSLSHEQTQAVFNFIKNYLMQIFPEGNLLEIHFKSSALKSEKR